MKPLADDTQEANSAPELPAELLEQLGLGVKSKKHNAKAKVRKTKKEQEITDLGDTAVADSGVVEASTETKTPATNEPPETDADNLEDVLETAENDAAVDAIVHDEGDAVLALDDVMRENAQTPPKHGFWHAIGGFFAAWWRIKWLRWLTILAILAGIGVVATVPHLRYKVLNVVGVRSEVTLTAVDEITQLPLKNVVVSVAGQQLTTNAKGYVVFKQVKLGSQTLTIRRLAYAPITQNITVGWGSNPQGNVPLSATGAQYVIVADDYLSGKPITNAEADSGQAAAVADQNGKISLELDVSDDPTTVSTTISAPNYRSVSITLDANTGTVTTVHLVPNFKDVFVAKENGKYNLVSMDIDGQNRATILAGTGNETSKIGLSTDPANKEAALVSTRDLQRDNDGFLLSALTMVNLGTGNVQTIDHAEQVQLIDWIGTKLIYQEATAGASAADSQRYKLISYDYATGARVQLATANQFNTIISAQGSVYYAPSSTDPNATAVLYRIKPDGTGKQTVLNSEVWSAFLTDYNTLMLQAPDGWYTYAVNSSTTPKKLPTIPTSHPSRIYVAGPTGRYAWENTQSGQGTLSIYDSSTNKDTKLYNQAGLGYPLHWLSDNAIVYRVATNSETADYVFDARGTAPKKLTDVVATTGLTQIN